MLEYLYEIDAVITIVDGSNIQFQLTNYEEAQNQIAYADKVVITKSDLISEQHLATIRQLIHSIQPFVPLVVFDKIKLQYDDIVGTNLYNKPQDIKHIPDSHSQESTHNEQCTCEQCNHTHTDSDVHQHEHAHHHHHNVTTFAIETTEHPNIERFDAWLNWVLDVCDMNLLRYKGIICFAGVEEEMVLQGVLTHATIDTNYVKIEKNSVTTIVFIGKELPEMAIRQKFLETLV